MPWPLSQDYNEAIQSPATSFADQELRGGHAAVNALGMPMPCSGNFADVYRLHCPATQRTWAVKCFTRQIPGLRERYQQISLYLRQLKLPFMVDFTFLDQGIRIRGDWYPILKMEWAEGSPLNLFVKDHLGKPQVLEKLCQIWVKLAGRLREAKLAHCDLQHGNVLLVPGSKTGLLGVKLVDYDGMCVPSLTMLKSLEVGHPSYQHPQRQREGIYNLEVDRFSHLVIYTALRSLLVGGKALWDRYDNGDNLLFCQADFKTPGASKLLNELRGSGDSDVRRLANCVVFAAQQPLDHTALLTDLVPDGLPFLAQPVAKPQQIASAASSAPPPHKQRASASGAAGDVGTTPASRRKAQARQGSTAKPRLSVAALCGLGAVVFLLATVALFAIGIALNRGTPGDVAGADASKSNVGKTEPSKEEDAGEPPKKKKDAEQRDNPIPGNGGLGKNEAKGIPLGSSDADKPEKKGEGGSTPGEIASIGKVPPPADSWGKTVKLDLDAALKMKLVRIEPGKFLMGSAQNEPGRRGDDESLHEVEITRPFYLGACEVTRGEFRAFVQATGYQTEAERNGVGAEGFNDNTKQFEVAANYNWKTPGFAQTDSHPVVNVTWNDAKAFCEWLSRKSGKLVTLPSEAEWEHACRAGTSTRYFTGLQAASVEGFANVLDRQCYALLPQLVKQSTFGVAPFNDGHVFTSPAAHFKTNAWGLHDMHGNVAEWCEDWYDKDYYQSGDKKAPQGPVTGSLRVVRGGSFFEGLDRRCRSAGRDFERPDSGTCKLGFRVAVRLPPGAKVDPLSPVPADTRKLWTYSKNGVKGVFEQVSERAWRETGPDGVAFRFVEIERTFSYVKLHDAPRDLFLYLTNDQCILSVRSSPYEIFYGGKWEGKSSTAKSSDVAKKEAQIVQRFGGHEGPVNDIALTPDGLGFVSGGDDQTVRRWELQSGKETWKSDRAKKVTALAILADGKTPICGFAGAHRYPMQVTPNGSVVCCTTNKTIAVFDPATNNAMSSAAIDSPTDAWVLAFTPDCLFALVVHKGESAVHVVELATGKSVLAIPNGDGPVAAAGAFYADVKRVAISGGPAGNVITLCDLAVVQKKGAGKADKTEPFLTIASRKTAAIRDSAAITVLHFSPDGRRLVCGHEDGTIRIWDVNTLEETHKFQANPARINRAVFLPDGRRLLVAGNDGSIVLWDLAE